MQRDYYTKDRITVNSKKYNRWKKMMEIGARTGCHQLPERSLFLDGCQLPLCARCTGVLIGYVAAVPLYVKFGFRRAAAGLGCAAMFADWCLQRLRLSESTNARRVVTGVAGGYGIMTIQLALFGRVSKLFKRIFNR